MKLEARVKYVHPRNPMVAVGQKVVERGSITMANRFAQFDLGNGSGHPQIVRAVKPLDTERPVIALAGEGMSYTVSGRARVIKPESLNGDDPASYVDETYISLYGPATVTVRGQNSSYVVFKARRQREKQRRNIL